MSQSETKTCQDQSEAEINELINAGLYTPVQLTPMGFVVDLDAISRARRWAEDRAS